MLRNLFYLLGSLTFAIILDEKLYQLIGWHLIDIITAAVKCVAWLLKGGAE